MTAKERAARGRPRSFDIDDALREGQALFHARGFDGVSLSAITDALGIAPPSFYSAFGSKAAFFERVLERYTHSTFSIDAILRGDRDAGEAIADLLSTAAIAYGADGDALGCLALENSRSCRDETGAAAAKAISEESRVRVREFVARTRPSAAESVSDFVAVTMHGLSACARDGWRSERLVAAAAAAGRSVAMMCEDDASSATATDSP